MTSVAHLDPVPFRTRVLHNEFNAIKIGEIVWITIRPEFVPMYDIGCMIQEGRVQQIIDDSENPEFHPSPDRLVVVKTEMGQWSFTRDGLSLNKICKLSVSRVHGQLLCLYEPQFTELPPPTERPFMDSADTTMVRVKTADCGCGPNGPCTIHAKTDASVEQFRQRISFGAPPGPQP